MPNDARLGLVVGITMVILVAVLFVRKDGTPGGPGPGGAAASNAGISRAQIQVSAPVPGLPGVPVRMPATGPRTHRVEEGESLMSVAVRYYGNAGYVSYLFNANRDRVRAPDHVPIGTVLRIPDVPAELAGGVPR